MAKEENTGQVRTIPDSATISYVLENYETLSIREFCEEHNVTKSQVGSWVNRARVLGIPVPKRRETGYLSIALAKFKEEKADLIAEWQKKAKERR